MRSTGEIVSPGSFVLSADYSTDWLKELFDVKTRHQVQEALDLSLRLQLSPLVLYDLDGNLYQHIQEALHNLEEE
jgi:hypothetical protein